MNVKHIKLLMEQIKAFCDRWQVTEFSLFGSVLRDDFRPSTYADTPLMGVKVRYATLTHPTGLTQLKLWNRFDH
ncbi:hypothetical protein [Coleofasciculus sp. E2-BRE-01]|uniref:hypothetical protein n=1 Tax=Coleofasciculus sp. E2-BRE-01 TaxID=3069524 RepID=UPI0032F491D3